MSGGVPPSSRARIRRPNPSQRDAIARGADLYERFSGHDPEIVGSMKIPDMIEVGVLIGDLDFLGYTTVRDGVTEKYIHKFRAADKPSLVVSVDGKSIHIIGGRYTFTERGIVDKSDKSR